MFHEALGKLKLIAHYKSSRILCHKIVYAREKNLATVVEHSVIDIISIIYKHERRGGGRRKGAARMKLRRSWRFPQVKPESGIKVVESPTEVAREKDGGAKST